jgi:hypothetical protein
MDKLDGFEKVEGYLKNRGWAVTRLAPGVLRTSFRGENATLPLVVQFEDSWCKLTVLPIARMPPDADKAERLYDKLLRLNGQIRLARFSLDEDGDVLLSVEFPTGDLNPSEIQDSLDVLTYYAQKHQAEIKATIA